MADENLIIELSMAELRAVTAYAVACSKPATAIFERAFPSDRRPRTAIEVAQSFAGGARRTKAIRDNAWAAHRAFQAARAAEQPAAGEAARAAVATASAAYLHPLAKATQVLHILGSAAHTARALELEAGDDPTIGNAYVQTARDLADPTVVNVLTRYPNAPTGRGRVGELLRHLDESLR